MLKIFHSRFRDECLNESWFLTIEDARQIIWAWRQDYNTERPHRSLDYFTRDEFERRWTSDGTADQLAYGSRADDPVVRADSGGPGDSVGHEDEIIQSGSTLRADAVFIIQ